MQRTSSVASTSSVSTNIPQFTSNLSPLIKLERLVFRLNSILAIDFDSLKDEVERKKHLKLLFEYQVEIMKLKADLKDESAVDKEFEYENRIQWIQTKIDLLTRINETEHGKEVKKPPSQEQPQQQNSSPLKSSSPVMIDEILPEKPEMILLSVPKHSSSNTEKDKENPQESLAFSESIQSEHDNLTNELIATVQLIKRNNLHIQKMVKADDKVISEASGLLATNSDSMQREGKNLKSFSKTAWVSFWKMLLILLFVCFTFFFVYIFIRLT